MPNDCCFGGTSGNIFKNSIDNYWIKCMKVRVPLARVLKGIYKPPDKKKLKEYFRRPFLGDNWSGQVVPKKDRLL